MGRKDKGDTDSSEVNWFRDVPFWGQQGSLGKCWRCKPGSKSKMKDASCNSPEDKRKIDQIRATSR